MELKQERCALMMERDIYRPVGKEYLHVNGDNILKINQLYIEKLKLYAQQNASRKCTMCLHNDVRAHVHEMINVYPAGAYVRPHSHPLKTETKTILEGVMSIFLFDDNGEIKDYFTMEQGGIFTFRIDRGIIHTNIPLTDVVFYEVVTGPFVGEDDSVFPVWAPEPADIERVSTFMKELEEYNTYLLDRRMK